MSKLNCLNLFLINFSFINPSYVTLQLGKGIDGKDVNLEFKGFLPVAKAGIITSCEVRHIHQLK